MIDVVAIPSRVTEIGRLGENEHRRVKFPIAFYREMYPGAAYTLNNLAPGASAAYPVANISTDAEYLYWLVSSADLTREGTGKCELTVTVDGVVAKSVIYMTHVSEALDGSGEAPEPWESWQQTFVEMKADAEQAAQEAEAAAQAVQDFAVSAETLPPSDNATVQKSVDPETGAVTLAFGLPRGDQGQPGTDGQDGADGVSPTVTVTDITGGHRVSVTDAEGTQTFDVMDGEDGAPGQDGVGVPSGGTTGQVLRKASGTDYDTEWADANPVVTVTSSTPSITALPGIRYVCGECTTLDITLPASGCIDVVFESGSTPTVLTITPPSGVTVKWANGFDPTSLEADTTYEINVCDGLGVAASWT